jgi:hypothetical protein
MQSVVSNLTSLYPKQWCKFDDDVVSRVAHSDAVLANFGGENAVNRGFTNAYMLVYIKKNAVGKLVFLLGPWAGHQQKTTQI